MPNSTCSTRWPCAISSTANDPMQLYSRLHTWAASWQTPTYRADFIYRNLQIQQNVIGQAWSHGVKRLLFLGSTCIYPREANQPITEDQLLTSPLEYTNEPYAIAKIAGMKLCESLNLQYGTDYISVMPTNLYGPNDNFHLENSHVLPAMIRKMHLARLLRAADFDTLRADIRLRPVSGLDIDTATEAQISARLAEFASTPTGSNSGAAVSRCASFFGAKTWQMRRYTRC